MSGAGQLGLLQPGLRDETLFQFGFSASRTALRQSAGLRSSRAAQAFFQLRKQDIPGQFLSLGMAHVPAVRLCSGLGRIWLRVRFGLQRGRYLAA
jgi:hypothetical protein